MYAENMNNVSRNLEAKSSEEYKKNNIKGKEKLPKTGDKQIYYQIIFGLALIGVGIMTTPIIKKLK